jgi:protein gp37
MAQTTIEWTATYRQDGTVLPGFTFNPWIGCTRVSPGCQHCYAETMMDKRYGKVKWGPQGTRVRTSADYWTQPLKWNREAAAAGERRRVFCASLADVFEDKPDQNHQLNQWRDELWWLIEKTPNLDWLLLTKRPEVVSDAIPTRWRELGWPPNVWIGTSVENQEYADKRIPELLKIPAAVRFLSVEPLLGPVDLYQMLWADMPGKPRLNRIHWIIVGGESGHGARPMQPDWVRSIRDQCQEAGVPFFFKQWGEYLYDEMNEVSVPMRVGKHRAGRLLDGREWNEFPNMV